MVAQKCGVNRSTMVGISMRAIWIVVYTVADGMHALPHTVRIKFSLQSIIVVRFSGLAHAMQIVVGISRKTNMELD